jgi:hypothetical protein
VTYTRRLNRHNGRERIDVDLRLSLLEIKRADQVDVLPCIRGNIPDDVGGGLVAGRREDWGGPTVQLHETSSVDSLCR